MRWSKEERAFAVEAYFSNGRSIIGIRRAFRTRFNIRPGTPLPGRQSIALWVNTFRVSGNVKKKHKGPAKRVRTTENIEAVRQSFVRSPRRSLRKHATALEISDRTVRRILHEELRFYPHKMAVVQQLTERDLTLVKQLVNRSWKTCRLLMRSCSLATRRISTFTVVWISKTSAIGVTTTHENFMRSLCIVNGSQFGVLFRKWE